MTYCLNNQCQKPQNPEGNKFCQNCGSKLLLSGRYRAIKPTGKGGFSRTFLAVDEGEGKRRCVIKQFRGQTQNAAELFRKEIARLEELGKHPQIPELLAHFELDDRQYLVQEYIEGQNLAEQLASEGAFSEEQLREVLAEVLPVLHFLHEGKLLHRDIKPANMIRRSTLTPNPSPIQGEGRKTGERGQIVLVGFGAAKYATETALAKTGTLIGSAEFAAPEQLLGKATFASDIYSLGVSCIYLLTDIHPFDLFDSMEGTWVWRDYTGNRVSTELGGILDKMLQQTVRRRYQSAEEVLKDLNPGLIPVRRQHFTVSSGSGEPVNERTIASASTSPPAVPAVPVSELPTRIAPPAPLPPPPPPPPPAPQPQWRCAATVDTSDSAVEVTSLAFSPQSRIIASSSWDGTVKLWDFTAGEFGQLSCQPLHTLAEHASGVMSAAISRDGQTLVTGSADCTVKVWRLWQLSPAELRAGTQPVLALTLAGHSNLVASVAISPDGRTIASGSRDRTIQLWDLKTAELLGTLTGHSDRVTCVTFSSDGQILASAGAEGTVKIWQVSTGELQHTLSGHAGAVNTVALSPDGKTAISGSWDRTVKLWNLQDGSLSHTLSGHLLSVAGVAVSPDGQTVATGSHDATIKLWNLPNSDGCACLPTPPQQLLLQTLSGHSRGVSAVAFSPDGQTVVSASQDGTVKIWRCD
ncbi:MAG: WD40 repeat domain-containing serine/threonine-protein kinase [Oscillatoria sp. Prado101]|jgi:WD40 repeat protein|nr:WD40 repeat domain-containing serine/threonine-protein kinase [Oscillatoria sp. Prado101]